MRPSVWRHASRTPTVFGIPAVSFLSVIIFCLHISWFTFYLTLISITFFAIMEKGFKFTLVTLAYRIRHVLRGNYIYARPWWWEKRFRDNW